MQNVTLLQAAWLPLRQAVDDARQLDARTFETWLAMLTVLVVRMNAEQAEQEWGRAA